MKRAVDVRYAGDARAVAAGVLLADRDSAVIARTETTPS